MLNSVVYPNIISAVYFLHALLLVWLMMTRVDRVIKSKFYISIMMILAALAALVGKSVIVYFMWKNKRIPTFTTDDILFYKNFGILILQKTVLIDNVSTFLNDFLEIILTIAVTIIYRQHYNDV
jgi:hypothetical protein